MNNDIDLSTLVTNVVAGNRFSHCRLCLTIIRSQYVRFTDPVAVDTKNGIFQPLNDVIISFLGDILLEDIPGIDAVCVPCVEKVLEMIKFVQICRKSTELVNKVFNNLSETLNNHLDNSNIERSLYIDVGEDNSKLIWMKNKERKSKSNHGVRQKDFACNECYKIFNSYNDLKAHNFSSHDSFTCDNCYKKFTSQYELTLHEGDVHKYKCPMCTQCRSTKEALKEHQERVHDISICKECGKACQGLDKLRIHEEKHNTTKHSCPKCGKTYTTRDFYTKHVKLCLQDLIDPHPIRSNIKRDYHCEICSKAYITPGGLRVHTRFAHGNAKSHVCHECGKQFTAPSILRNHMIKHTGERNFICDLCGGRFVSKEALLYHTRRHTGEKPFSCKICNERFVNSSARAEHIKFKHVGPQLACQICPRKFVTTYFLKQHISRHHDPSSKLYYGRNMIPPNMPGEQNMRTFHIEYEK